MNDRDKELLKPYENIGCKFFGGSNILNPIDCFRFKHTNGSCDRCGWNPVVNRARMVERFGEAQTRYNELHSQLIADRRRNGGKDGDRD